MNRGRKYIGMCVALLILASTVLVACDCGSSGSGQTGQTGQRLVIIEKRELPNYRQGDTTVYLVKDTLTGKVCIVATGPKGFLAGGAEVKMDCYDDIVPSQ